MEYRIVEREAVTLLARVEQFPSEAITDPDKVSYSSFAPLRTPFYPLHYKDYLD